PRATGLPHARPLATVHLTVDLHCAPPRPALRSSPTRRSSDLKKIVVGQKRTGQPRHGTANHECHKFEAVHRVPQRFHTSFVFAKDRKSTRLNSSHVSTSYAVFCLKKTSAGANARRKYWPARQR